MSNHDLKYAILVPETTAIGESVFATARTAIEKRYSLSPVEVFLDGVQSDGVISAGDLQLDLDELQVRLFSFGATSDGATALTPATPVSETPIADSIAAPSTAIVDTVTEPATTPVPPTDTTTTTTTAV